MSGQPSTDHQVIVVQFTSLDGVVEDPDGADGTPQGGWAFRDSSVAVSPDPFRLGDRYDHGVMLLGRRTSEKLAAIFAGRDDEFPRRLTAAEKLVASRSGGGTDGWPRAEALHGDLAEEVVRRRARQDVLVLGSGEVVDQLVAADLVDQYRLLVFPVVVGAGRRLFDAAPGPLGLTLTSTEHAGDGVVRNVYDRRRSA